MFFVHYLRELLQCFVLARDISPQSQCQRAVCWPDHRHNELLGTIIFLWKWSNCPFLFCTKKKHHFSLTKRKIPFLYHKEESLFCTKKKITFLYQNKKKYISEKKCEVAQCTCLSPRHILAEGLWYTFFLVQKRWQAFNPKHPNEFRNIVCGNKREKWWPSFALSPDPKLQGFHCCCQPLSGPQAHQTLSPGKIAIKRAFKGLS